MRTLYIDCSNGVSGDMLLAALQELAGDKPAGDEPVGDESGETKPAGDEPAGAALADHNTADHHTAGHHTHRSLQDVRKIIDMSEESDAAKGIALRIYEVIAAAEAKVHGETIDTVHFHEVGRDRAIANALGIGRAIEALGLAAGANHVADAGRIIASDICDGKGFVDCAHGRIPVPVPAVQAIMDECGRKYPALSFKTCPEVETEMVTPSGLAGIIGIGAAPAGEGMVFMEGTIIAAAEAEGTRNTGRGGLRAFLIEK